MSDLEYLEDKFDRHSVDAALLLVLWSRASSEETGAGGRLRLMKLAYFAARKMAEASICGLSLSFYRWKYGPMCNEVYEIWEQLRAAGMLEEEEVWDVTADGLDLAESFYRDVLSEEANAPIKRVIDETCERWRTDWSAQLLMQHTFGLAAKIDGTGPTIRDLPLGSEFESPPDLSSADVVLSVPNSWVETITLLLNPNTMPMLKAAVEDFRAGRILVA